MEHGEHMKEMAQAGASSGLWEEIVRYFSQLAFMPHGHCYLWKPGLVWTHVISDFLIGLAYVSISLSLYALIRRIQVAFSTMVLAFGVFIGACGATHFMEVWNLWNADYWTSALVKVVTALASVATGVWLVRLRPEIVRMAEAAKLSEQRRWELERINKELERKSAELLEMNQTLAEQQKLLAHSAKMSALGEMAGGIAHEINSPLAIITVHANQVERLCTRGALTPDFITREAQLIARTAKRIGDIIKGLRAFAREGSNDPFEPAAVNTIINDALVLCQTRFRNHDVDLQVPDVPDELTIRCRSVQITQVLLNLLANAYDAVVDLKDKWVRVEVEEEGDHLRIMVTDSGTGIAPQIQDKIMQPFFTTKEVGRGTGLGLSISKGIVEAHKGTLQFDDAHPNTRFVVTLPKRAPEETAGKGHSEHD